MSKTMTARLSTATHSLWTRSLAALLLVGLLVGVFASSAMGAGASDDANDYSLYGLASNASAYFGNENSPDDKHGCDEDSPADCFSKDVRTLLENPGEAGSFAGYADAGFSLSLKWGLSEISGSSQTMAYDMFRSADNDGVPTYNGLLTYAYFGAANADLGFDSMSSNTLGEIVHAFGGSIMLLFYAVALIVSWVFWVVIQILKVLNPFVWFYEGVKGALSPLWAEGMVSSTDAAGVTTSHTDAGIFSGLAGWISSWYGILQNMAWGVMIPLFLGFLLFALFFFPKLNKGSMFKKLMVRVLFIAVGLPLIGSMYTGVLDKFDSVTAQAGGASNVVLSTYVDFGGWMNEDRLAIPETASIGWDAGRGAASSQATMSARSSALAINKSQKAYEGAGDSGALTEDASAAFRSSAAMESCENTITEDAAGAVTVSESTGCESDGNLVGSVISLLARYVSSQQIYASDFESSIKGEIANMSDVKSKDKSAWFTHDSYKDSEKFGDEGGTKATEHPLLSVSGNGLTSSAPGGAVQEFSTGGVTNDCGYAVGDSDGKPANCNMAPLAAFNYLNSSFDTESVTAYSSAKALSGMTRETHSSVSQVGTGVNGFMYWVNATTLLLAVSLIGLLYAIGMLVGSVKRTFHAVSSIPFATVGAISAISKVIIHSAALILEVFMTLFVYQFAAEVILSVPAMTEGPLTTLVSNKDSIFAKSDVLGGAAMLVMTLFSTILIWAVTIILIKVRKQVLEALNEMSTKLVDKFLDTNNVPPNHGPGMGSALASGAGAGLGMAGANAGMNAMKDRFGGGSSPKSPKTTGGGGGTGQRPGGSNVAGTGGSTSVAGGGSQGALPVGNNGPLDGEIIDDDNSGSGGGGGGNIKCAVCGERPCICNGGGISGGRGGPALTAGSSGSSAPRSNSPRSMSDKQLASKVGSQGGLSKLGMNTSGAPLALGAGRSGSPRALAAGSAGNEGAGGKSGDSSSTSGKGGSKGTAGAPGSSTQGVGGAAGKESAAKRAALGLMQPGNATQGDHSTVGGTSAAAGQSGAQGALGAAAVGAKPTSNGRSGAQGTKGALGAAGGSVQPMGAGAAAMKGGSTGPADVAGTRAETGSTTAGAVSQSKEKAKSPLAAGTVGSKNSIAGTSSKAGTVNKKAVAGGATMGAANGAMTGAKLGSLVPGVGTAAGAITGGTTGAVIGGVKGGRPTTKGAATKVASSGASTKVAGVAGSSSGSTSKPAVRGNAARGVAGTPVASASRMAQRPAATAAVPAANREATATVANPQGRTAPSEQRVAAATARLQAGTASAPVAKPAQSTPAGKPVASQVAKSQGSAVPAAQAGPRVAAATANRPAASPVTKPATSSPAVAKPQAAPAAPATSQGVPAALAGQRPPAAADRPQARPVASPVAKPATSATAHRPATASVVKPAASVPAQRPVSATVSQPAPSVAPASKPATSASAQVAKPVVSPVPVQSPQSPQPPTRRAARAAENAPAPVQGASKSVPKVAQAKPATTEED